MPLSRDEVYAKVQSVLEEALVGFEGTVVLVSHDAHFVESVADEIWDDLPEPLELLDPPLLELPAAPL